MSIVSDRNVQDALTYLADDPHPIAVARKTLTDAESASKLAFANAFLLATGAEGARKAAAEINPEYQDAKADEAEAQLEFERHKSRCKAAEMIIEIWRSENANARAAERVR
jgi:hypothetical protein